MAVEQAIIQLVVQGQTEVSAEADRIVVNLTSVERAGKRAEEAAKAAEDAAKEAEAASRKLSSDITKTLRALSRAAHMAKKIASGLGYEKHSRVESAIEIIGGGLKGAAMGARLGSVFGPCGTAIGAIGGGLYGEYAAYSHEKQAILEHNQKAEEHEAKRLAKERDEELAEALLRQVGLYKLDQHHFGPRQVP